MPTQHTLQFLKNLDENNNREWFQIHRNDYDQAKASFENLSRIILTNISQFQNDLHTTKVKDCIFRINRDIRFSKDKSPYKKFFSAGFGPGGRHSGKIDYYLQLQPNNETFIGGGMWSPTSAQLAAFRQEIDYNPAIINGIIYNDNFRRYYDKISGEKVKLMPKGYTADHPDIELLKYKELFFYHKYTDEEVLDKDFAIKVTEGCYLLKPYIDYLNHLFFENNQ